MLDKVKLALRITTDVFDSEIEDLIAAALADLGLAGVEWEAADTESNKESDPLLTRAVVTFCKANFGESDQYDRLKAAYDEQKAQLQMATGYTDWGEDNG